MGAEARGAARLAKVVELALASLDLSLPQFRVLILLDDDARCGEGAGAGALAESLAVSRPSVTGLVDGLVARGLVERLADDADRRRVRHALTAAGRLALDRADAAVDRTFDAVLAPLPAVERARALDALAAWNGAIDAAARARLAGSRR